MAVQYAPTKLRVPPGFQNILEGFAREVLREQPEDVVQFAAHYFKTQLSIREETGKDDAKKGENLEKLQAGEEVDIDLKDPEVQAAATKIQASFRGHKAREDVKHKKEEETAALKIQSSFRGHKAREEVKELKEQRSRESAEISPTKEPEKPSEDEVDIDLNDPEVQGAALKIQASFRGHKARTEVQKKKSSESVLAATEGEVEKEGETEKKEEEVDIDLNDPEVQNAATVIQAGFRARKSRESVKSVTQEEEAKEEPKVDNEAPDQDEENIPAPSTEQPDEIDVDLKDPEVGKGSPTPSQESLKTEQAVAETDQTASQDAAPEPQTTPDAESEPQAATKTEEPVTDTALDVASETQMSAPETEEAALETQDATPETQEAAPETQEATPETQEAAPETQEAALETQAAVPEPETTAKVDGQETEGSPEESDQPKEEDKEKTGAAAEDGKDGSEVKESES